MTRINIIYDLAKYAHPSWYHSLLSWTTPQLGRLLDYYQHPDKYHARTLTVSSYSSSPYEVVISRVCEWCDGSGIVSTDEYDADSGQYMSGVGTDQCICQYD